MIDLDRIVVHFSNGRSPIRQRDCYRDNPTTRRREALGYDGKPNGDWETAESVEQRRVRNANIPPWGAYAS